MKDGHILTNATKAALGLGEGRRRATWSTRLIHWKLSSSVESGRCSATITILSSCSTVTENTAILQGQRGGTVSTGRRCLQEDQSAARSLIATDYRLRGF